MALRNLVAQQGAGLETDLPTWLQEPVSTTLGFLPELIGALIILVIGWVVGRFVGGIVRQMVDRFQLDRQLLGTPLGDKMGGTEASVAGFFGKLVKWFIYGLAFLAAANLLAIPLLSQWISVALTYLPAFIGGVLVIVLGFVLADWIGDAIERTDTATRTGYTEFIADGVRVFLYFTAIVIGLDTMAVDVTILYIFGRAVSWGVALGIALALGIGFGWGSKDYISENIERWSSKARERTSGS
ncbi:MAG: hypothetical protein H8Z69_03195 [Nanohaloarchaea archaeon]|nr:hypothetical protein [Candidatus Nanohaloarchaea archaeon]